MAVPHRNEEHNHTKGSTQLVTEFFQYALSSILYQRGVYPAENFDAQKKYGLTVMAVKDPKLCRSCSRCCTNSQVSMTTAAGR